MTPERYRLVVAGGGPAGIAPLLAAHRHGRLEALLDEGVMVIEQSDRLGGGDIGNYAINSDSTGTTFVDCLKSPTETPLTRLADHPVAVAIRAAGEGSVPLVEVGKLMCLVGDALHGMIEAHPHCAVLTGHRVRSVRRHGDAWSVFATDSDGHEIVVRAANVASATGARQPQTRLAAERVAGVGLVERWGDKLVQSGEVLATGGLERIAARLAGRATPRIAVIGGSTSAVAVAHALLHRMPDVSFAPGGITLLHRRALPIYYPTEAAALAEGYDEFGPDDVCPVSNRVFRLGGFRLDSRELIMQVRGIGGRAAEPRMVLHRLHAHDPEATRILDEADIVVAALGYRPNALPIVAADGTPVALLAHRDARSPLVDGQCRILNASGTPLPGLFAIGLAAGFVPHGKLGGERSFVGQANGLWLWQNDVGLLIVDAVMADDADAGQPDAATLDALLSPSNAARLVPAASRQAAVALEA